MKTFALLSTCSFYVAAVAAGVTMKESTITLPTYAPGGFDKTPVFYTGRVYQGAQGRVYPYPMQDVLHDEKRDEVYRYLTMENDWLQFGVLPEHGGHLLNLTDKKTGFETFYRQHVVKPALIGMLGAWISGGVEWNFPHHHRATSAMPIDWRLEKDRRTGRQTIWLGETELRRRLKWTVGLSLASDRAVLQAENIFMNRGPYVESMLYWANVAVHCGENYQVLFPPSCHVGFDHHKNFWTTFPMGPKKVDRAWKPGAPGEELVDLSWWKNFTAVSRSIFALDPDNDWIAGWDHKRNMGTAHVSNRHITVGKKFFLWGNFPGAQLWDSKVLTDSDGPYLELMVGCWSDNQPDYSWIDPYETRTVKQFWFPVKGIGGVKNASIDGAVNLERRGADEFLMGFHSTRALKGCTVRLSVSGSPRAGSRQTVFEAKNVAIDPDTPWCRPVKLDAAAAKIADQAFTATIADASGKVFLAYTPVPADPHDQLPPVVENPRDPKTYANAEEAYLTGLRLDQFHNGLIDPAPYYARALELDANYSPALVARATRNAKNGDLASAEKDLRLAVARVTRNHTRARDAEPEYLLARVLEEQGELAGDDPVRAAKFKESEALYWRATWRATHARQAYAGLARLACRKGDWEEALARANDALDRGAKEAKLHVAKAYALRRLNRPTEASKALRAAQAADPLDAWGVAERAFLEDDGLEAALGVCENRGLRAQTLLEVVCDYWELGAWREVAVLCDQADALAAREKPYRTEGALPLADLVAACASLRSPLFGHFAGHALERMGQRELARKRYAGAASLSVDGCFPNRREEEAVLRAAAACLPEAANTWYLLGNLEWNQDRKEAALASWRKAVALKADHALALRNLGFGLAHPGSYFTNTGAPAGVANEEAYACYEKALAADPSNYRALAEMDALAERLGRSGADRLATLKRFAKTAEAYDPCMLSMANLLNEAGDYDAALAILAGRRFHVWEGGGSLLEPFVNASLLRGLAKMDAKDLAGAKADFERALTYPENLQVAPPTDAGLEPRARWCLARCLKAQGDAAGARAQLEKALEGDVKAGEMNYYRVLALRELGVAHAEKKIELNLAALRGAAAALEHKEAKLADASAKFVGAGSAANRLARDAARAKYLRGLVLSLEGKDAEAKALFAEAAAKVPSLLWARRFAK